MQKQPKNKMLTPDYSDKEYNGDLMLTVAEYSALIGKHTRTVMRMIANDYHLPGVRKVLGSVRARVLVVSKEYFSKITSL